MTVVELSNPGKVLFPDDGITKADLARYYERVAGHMLPHVRGRPVHMQRFPDGIDGQEIQQKQAPDYFPDFVERVEVGKKGGGTVTHVVIETVRVAARALPKLLDELGLATYLKTTGSRGYHVVVPLDRSAGFDEARAFAREVAKVLVARLSYPRRLARATAASDGRGPSRPSPPVISGWSSGTPATGERVLALRRLESCRWVADV